MTETDIVARLRAAFDGDDVPRKNIALRRAHDVIERQASDFSRMREALEGLVNAKALSGVEAQVAGWEGPEKQYTRHPANLGAQIKTNCGRVYELRDLILAARAALSPAQKGEA